MSLTKEKWFEQEQRIHEKYLELCPCALCSNPPDYDYEEISRLRKKMLLMLEIEKEVFE